MAQALLGGRRRGPGNPKGVPRWDGGERAPPTWTDSLRRAKRTPVIRRAETELQAARLRHEVLSAISEGRAHQLIPLTGQTAGMITEVLPAAEIVRQIVADAATALRSLQPLLG
jgi:NAD(P)H-dependent flavin oxidoreductase YrpB (nitropropane dioxygenase family)